MSEKTLKRKWSQKTKAKKTSCSCKEGKTGKEKNMADVNIENVQTEDKPDGQTMPISQQGNTDDTENQDVKDLLKKIADLQLELKKNKNARDKALSEAGEYKKQLRAKLSADEQAEIERQELEAQQKEYVASLEKFKRVAEATARYALQGMNQDLAKQAADAEINGDMDALADIQKKHTQQVVKEAQAEWIKSRPQANIGGSGGANVTQEQFDNMNMIQRTKLLEEQPDVYRALLENSK